MNTQPLRLAEPPRIVAIGQHRIKDLLRDLAPSYAGHANVEILDTGFATAVANIKLRTRTARQGIEVVVAPGLVTDLAEAAGMSVVFLYSEDAVREALDDAVEIARRSRMEAAKRERLNTILGQLRDGVVAVDMNERIEILKSRHGSPARTAGC